MRLSDEELREMKENLSAEVVDDAEEWIEWLGTNGVELINEVLEYRAKARQISR